jgi:hypothetical protein
LLDARLSGGHYHKNIAYKPASGKTFGVGKNGCGGGRAAALGAGGIFAAGDRLCTRTAAAISGEVRLDFASLRPLEEAGRGLPLKKRNDLLHTDAFPTQPTNRGLILRFFTNVHPTGSVTA